MIGYHYTDARNLKRILKQGLIPYPCPKTSTDLWGVFVFKKRQAGRNLLGSVLWQVTQKNCDEVVELQVRYEAKYSFCSKKCVVDREPMAKPRYYINMTHQGVIEKYTYHVPAVETDCVLTMIHPPHIKHLATYRLEATKHDRLR